MQVTVYGLTMAIHGVSDDTSRIDGLSIQRLVRDGKVEYVAYSADLREVLEVNHGNESRNYVRTLQILDQQMRNMRNERVEQTCRIAKFNNQRLWARLCAVIAGRILE